MLHPQSRKRWKIYVDNWNLGEVVDEATARRLLGQASVEQLAVRGACDLWSVPPAPDKSVSRSLCAPTMGSMVGRVRGIALPSLEKLLSHLVLIFLILIRNDVCKTWIQAVLGRWSFDSQHRRACYGVLSHIWGEVTQWRGRGRISSKGSDELV